MAASLLGYLFRRGTGVFKLLFAVDDAIRVAAMTLLFWISLTLMGASKPVVWAGVALGLVIDIHDLIDNLRNYR